MANWWRRGSVAARAVPDCGEHLGKTGADRIGCHRRRHEGRAHYVYGCAVRRPTRWRAALARTAAGCAVERHAPGHLVRTGVHAERRLDARGEATRDERGLPVSEHLDPGQDSGRTPARHGLDSRRRLYKRIGIDAAVLGRQAGAARRRGRDHRLSTRSARLSRASGAHSRVGKEVLGQLWTARSDRGARMDTTKHRGLRRRSASA